MKRPILFLSPLIGMILIMASCVSLTNEKSLANIGCVVYVKNSDRSGNLCANWAYTLPDGTTTVGTGYTTQSPKSPGFEGDYRIYYRGAQTDSFDLAISLDIYADSSSYYRVSWKDIETGKIRYYGTGIEKDSQLIVGWRE